MLRGVVSGACGKVVYSSSETNLDVEYVTVDKEEMES